MSSKIEGIFPHHVTSYQEFERIAERLGAILEQAVSLDVSYWQSGPTPAQAAWQIGLWGPPWSRLDARQQWEAGEGPMILGPGPTHETASTRLVFGRRCLFVTTGIKWWVAMDRPELLRQVRDFFASIAGVLKSHAFILHRENGGLSWDWVLRGKTLDEIEREFAAGGAQAVSAIEDLRDTGPEILKTGYFRENLE